MRYFHGGIPNLRPGDLVTPHEANLLDDCPVCEAKRAGISTLIDPIPHQPERVYITTDREYARFYASKYPCGDLYVVAPEGELRDSQEDPFPTWTAPAARVTSVYARAVVLTWSQRRAILRRWRDPLSGELPTRSQVADMERGIAVGGNLLAHARHRTAMS